MKRVCLKIETGFYSTSSSPHKSLSEGALRIAMKQQQPTTTKKIINPINIAILIPVILSECKVMK